MPLAPALYNNIRVFKPAQWAIHVLGDPAKAGIVKELIAMLIAMCSLCILLAKHTIVSLVPSSWQYIASPVVAAISVVMVIWGLVYMLIKILARWRCIKMHNSVLLPITDVTNRNKSRSEPNVKISRLESRSPRNDAEITAIAQLMDYIFNRSIGTFSPVTLEKRTVLYKWWVRNQPNSLVGIWKSYNKCDTLIGCSILLKISNKTFDDYVNGKCDPWDWTGDGPMDNSCNDKKLFWQTSFCWPYASRLHMFLMLPITRSNYGYFLGKIIMEHLWKTSDRSIDGFSIICPRKTKSGINNISKIGGVLRGHSNGGYPLYIININSKMAQTDSEAKLVRTIANFDPSQCITEWKDH